MIVGRKEEIAELDKLYYSDRPEFVAIYGRRRVGKTFLIKQALNQVDFVYVFLIQYSDKSSFKYIDREYMLKSNFLFVDIVLL